MRFAAPVLAVLLAACGGGLSDGAFVWCQTNSDAVGDAAIRLGEPQTTYKFWAIQGSAGALTSPALRTDPDFVRACTLAHTGAAATTLADADWTWCSDLDNWGTVLKASDQLGIAHVSAPFGALPWQAKDESDAQMRGDPDYAKACQAAYEAR